MMERPQVLISEQKIYERVGELAAKISADYAGCNELVLVGVLRGAYIFIADLSRRLALQTRVDFVSASSYGNGTESSGDVCLPMDMRTDVRGKHVLIVEDIIDTGETLKFLTDRFSARGPASLGVCSLLRKPKGFSVETQVKYIGFDIPDVWAVGYGLDLADRYRSLPYIGIVEFDASGGG